MPFSLYLIIIIIISCTSTFILGHFRYQLFQLPVTFMGTLVLQPRCSCMDQYIGSWIKIDSWPLHADISSLSYQLLKFFPTTELFLHWITGTCSFLDAPFYSRGVWCGYHSFLLVI